MKRQILLVFPERSNTKECHTEKKTGKATTIVSCFIGTLFLVNASCSVINTLWFENQIRNLTAVNSNISILSGNATSSKLIQPRSQEVIKVFQYVLHIPKTGGTYLKDIANNLLMETAEWANLKHDDKPYLCDLGVKRHEDISGFPETFIESNKVTGYKCTAYMAEGDYNTRADYIYTILREPFSHVLSQYFHCKEATVHKQYWDRMPSLDEWLEYWYNQTINADSLDVFEQMKLEGRRNKFKCYMPVNLQSHLLNLNHTLILIEDEDIALREIQSRFTILGDNFQMNKTVCSIVARYSGIVPLGCDCSDVQEQRRATADHGVIHHGNTFNITNQQRKWIDEITKVDQKLYKYGKIIFGRQVEKLEKDYSVKICD